MTDEIEIDPEAEAFARARYESGRPMLGSHFDDPPDPTMRGTVADGPVVELVLALIDEDGRVDGDPVPGDPGSVPRPAQRAGEPFELPDHRTPGPPPRRPSRPGGR